MDAFERDFINNIEGAYLAINSEYRKDSIIKMVFLDSLTSDSYKRNGAFWGFIIANQSYFPADRNLLTPIEEIKQMPEKYEAVRVLPGQNWNNKEKLWKLPDSLAV